MIKFKKLTFSLTLTGLLSMTPAIAMESDSDGLQSNAVTVRPTYQELKTIGSNYITFLQKIRDTPVIQDDVSQLFAPQCKKVVNNEVILTSSSDLPAQLNKAREIAGNWEIIETTTMTASSEDGTCALQFKWKAKNLEKEHTTMKILWVDESRKIYKIEEVYNECSKNPLGS